MDLIYYKKLCEELYNMTVENLSDEEKMEAITLAADGIKDLCEFIERPQIDTNIYDKVEYHFGVSVQVLTNSLTGETSIGWSEPDSEISQEWMEDYLSLGVDNED